jgi:hypothetical protein
MNAAHLLFAIGLPVAQAAPMAPPVPPLHLILPSVSFGSPLRTSAGVAYVLLISDPSAQLVQGPLVEASAGQGGWRASAGWARFLEFAGIDARAVLTRTFASPRVASPHATYAGAEAGLTIYYARVSGGFASRVAGSSGRSRIFTWSAALQIPIK